jgi:hypothetical protein
MVEAEVKTSFTYLADTVIEFVIDGDVMHVNVLPNAANVGPMSANVPAAAQEPVLATPVPDEGLCAAAAPAKRSVGKNVAAFIRGTWTFLIAIFVEGGTYLVNNLTSLHIPPGFAIGGGALLQGAIYATKKRAFPDTTL